MEIRRFGIGHRRREQLPGTHGVFGRAIHDDVRGHIAELAFERNASITPHTNPNTTWFVVIEGGGFVQVGDEEERVAAGEAVLWPANVLHAAKTGHSPMRAIVVEFAGDEPPVALLIDGRATPVQVPGELDEGGEVGAAGEVGEVEWAGGADEGGRAGAEPARGSLRAEGKLAPKPSVGPAAHVSDDQEPW